MSVTGDGGSSDRVVQERDNGLGISRVDKYKMADQ